MSCRKRLKHKHNAATGKTNRGVLKGWNDRINDSLCTKTQHRRWKREQKYKMNVRGVIRGPSLIYTLRNWQRRHSNGKRLLDNRLIYIPLRRQTQYLIGFSRNMKWHSKPLSWCSWSCTAPQPTPAVNVEHAGLWRTLLCEATKLRCFSLSLAQIKKPDKGEQLGGEE